MASAAVRQEKLKWKSMMREVVIQAAMLPAISAMAEVASARMAYSMRCDVRMRRRVAPSVFRITACLMRRRWAVASAPASTSAPASSVTLPATRTATMMRWKIALKAAMRVLDADGGGGGKRLADLARQLRLGGEVGAPSAGLWSRAGCAARRPACWARTP